MRILIAAKNIAVIVLDDVGNIKYTVSARNDSDDMPRNCEEIAYIMMTSGTNCWFCFSLVPYLLQYGRLFQRL